MKKITFLLVAVFMCNILFGQVKVDSFGKLYIGTMSHTNHDADNVLAASIFGPNTMSSGSRLAFGDFGRFSYGGGNVLIGEYGTTDTDQLWLHGKLGMYFTRSSTRIDIVAYCGATGNDAFYFNTNVYSKSVLLSSDARFKTNVEKIETPLFKLMALDGVSYDFSDKLRQDDLLEKHNSNNTVEGEPQYINESELTEKERAYLDYEALVNQQETKEHKLGFIAQDLQKVFPDLVKEDDLGYLSIDYIGLIPVIVEAVKEQQQFIENLQQKEIDFTKEQILMQQEIEALKKALNTCCETSQNNPIIIDNVSTVEQNSSVNNSEKIILYQNAPNPFNEVTNIQCYIPLSIKNAELCIYDIKGIMQKCIMVSGRETTNVQIQASALYSGIYAYLIMGDGIPSDAKTMIITK